jgi:hypothetical protein
METSSWLHPSFTGVSLFVRLFGNRFLFLRFWFGSGVTGHERFAAVVHLDVVFQTFAFELDSIPDTSSSELVRFPRCIAHVVDGRLQYIVERLLATRLF